jgi:hypothetical protein
MTIGALEPSTPPRPTGRREAIRCEACGTPATGIYCYHCGAGIGEEACARCGHLSRRGSRFCTGCGGSLQSVRFRTRAARWLPWLLGGAGALVLAGLLLRPSRAPGPQGLAPPGRARSAVAPPDLSGLSPRERFDRLYRRIIAAAQGGDQPTVQQLTPMAIGAFTQLDSVDADARYHLAMLQLHVGDASGAQAQADSIVALEPSHLFGYVIGAAVARWTGNQAGRDARYREFLARYDPELALDRAEYREHRLMLVEVKRAADSLLGGR